MPTAQEVSRHNTRQSCWIVIANQAYDVTDFLDDHPGGPNVILRLAGKDATEEYEPIHPPGTIETLPREKYLGFVDPSTWNQEGEVAKSQEVRKEKAINPHIPHLHTLQNLDDFEHIAHAKLSPKAWLYFSSAADDLRSLSANRTDWDKISLRPRVLRDVARLSLRRKILGHESSLPIFIAPAALAKLGHPDGELCLARGAARHNIVFGVSTYSSVSHEDIASCIVEERESAPSMRVGGGALAFQLYLPKNKEEGGRQLIAKAKKLGYTSLIVTIDTAVVGKREADERYKAELEVQDGGVGEIQRPGEPGDDKPVLRGAHSSSVTWKDLQWIRAEWGAGPIIIKGIQTAEDALRASEVGVQGIYLSNHGGRQLDHAPTSIQTLLEIHRFSPGVLRKVEVYLDGGVRRGTDVVKALCLGATAVGLGRPFMYALSAYGVEGVVKLVQVISDEIETALRLLGVQDISQLNQTFVNSTKLERDLPSSRNVDPILIRNPKL